MRHEYNGMNKAFLCVWEEVGAYEGTSRQGPERGIHMTLGRDHGG